MDKHLGKNQQLRSISLHKIAIVRSLPGLGDLLCFTPALRALRTALPNAEITLIGLPQTKSIVKRFGSYIDCLLEFPGYPGISEVSFSPQKVVSFLAEVQQLEFDLALQMHGNGSCTNSFTMLLGAKRSAGFFASGYTCPDPNWFIPYPEDEPEIWRYLRLLESLDIPLQGDQLEFPIWQSDWQEFNAIASASNLHSGKYVCIHPGASVGARRWSWQNFVAVADGLAARGLQIVLTGNAAESGLTRSIAERVRFPAIDLAGKTSLGAIAALLENACLLICNDTGISHLSAALQVKSVVIFSNSDPNRWAPLNQNLHRVLGECVEKTKEGTFRRSACDGVNGKRNLTPTDVLVEAAHLLEQEVAHAS